MKKVILLICVLTFVGLLAWLFLFRGAVRPAVVPEQGGGSTVGAPVSVPTDVSRWKESWTPAVDMGQVPTEDPLKGKDMRKLGTPLDDRGTVELSSTDEYAITFYGGSDSSIFITLLAKPLEKSRMDAEQALLSKLGIDKAAACRLNVVLNTVSWVDEAAAGPNYGLSFCPGALPLP